MPNAHQFRPLPAVKPDLSSPTHHECNGDCPKCGSKVTSFVPGTATYEVSMCTSEDCDWDYDPSDWDHDPFEYEGGFS